MNKKKKMSNNKLRGKDLNKIGFENDASRSIAIVIASRHMKHFKKEEILNTFQKVKENPEAYEQDEVLAPLANTFVVKNKIKDFTSYQLLEEKGKLKVYGSKEIEESAKQQMEVAMSLPQAEWPQIEEETRKNYLKGFQETLSEAKLLAKNKKQ